MSIDQILSNISHELERLMMIDFGYPLGQNSVLPPSSKNEHDAKALHFSKYHGLYDFHRLSGGIDAPDLGNGVFIHSATRIRLGREREDPLSVTGVIDGQVYAIGSNGGGAWFLLHQKSAKIYIVREAAIYNQVLECEPYNLISQFISFDEFLNCILREACAFINDSPDFAYNIILKC